MKILVFAKKRKNKEGREFTTYSTKLHKADGSELFANVKFREDCGSPKYEECPCYVDVERADANLNNSTRQVVDEDTGVISNIEDHTLWVKAWKLNPEKYVDTSLDGFVD